MNYHPLLVTFYDEFANFEVKGKEDYILAKYEDAFDHFFESGETLAYYSKSMQGVFNWSAINRLTGIVNSAIHVYMKNPKKQSYLIENIVKSKAARGFESTFYHSACKLDGNFGALRSADNKLFPKPFFKKTQSKTNLPWILNSIFRDDDVSALKVILEIPFYRKALEGDNLKRSLTGVCVEPDSEAYKVLMNTAPGSSLDNYLNMLLAMDRAQNSAFAEKVYLPEYSKEYGHVLIDYVMRQWHINSSPGQLKVVTKMVEDGADWYLAYKQASVSPSIYLDLVGREVKPLVELKEMLDTWDKTPTVKKNLNVLGYVLSGLPDDLLEVAKNDPDNGRRVRRLLANMQNESALEP
jgi:hypothetical protein